MDVSRSDADHLRTLFEREDGWRRLYRTNQQVTFEDYRLYYLERFKFDLNCREQLMAVLMAFANLGDTLRTAVLRPATWPNLTDIENLMVVEYVDLVMASNVRILRRPIDRPDYYLEVVAGEPQRASIWEWGEFLVTPEARIELHAMCDEYPIIDQARYRGVDASQAEEFAALLVCMIIFETVCKFEATIHSEPVLKVLESMIMMYWITCNDALVARVGVETESGTEPEVA